MRKAPKASKQSDRDRSQRISSFLLQWMYDDRDEGRNLAFLQKYFVAPLRHKMDTVESKTTDKQ